MEEEEEQKEPDYQKMAEIWEKIDKGLIGDPPRRWHRPGRPKTREAFLREIEDERRKAEEMQRNNG